MRRRIFITNQETWAAGSCNYLRVFVVSDSRQNYTPTNQPRSRVLSRIYAAVSRKCCLVLFLLIGFQAAGFPLDLALRPWVVFLRFLFQTNSVITRSYTSCHGSNFLSNNNNTKPTYRICSFAWFYHGTGPSSPWPWPICPGAGCSITSYYDKYQVQWPFGAASPRLLEISVLFFRWLTHP
jgi:hypothetical protein